MRYGSVASPPRSGGLVGERDANGSVWSIDGSSSDPTDEVRTVLTTLNARAQRLVNDGVDHRVVCSGRSLFEVSRRAAEETGRQAQRSSQRLDGSTAEGGPRAPGAAVELPAPAAQASVELFMAKHLGFDSRAQERLLRQLCDDQQRMAADLASVPMGQLAGGEHGAVMAPSATTTYDAYGRVVAQPPIALTGAAGVDALVARLKGESIAHAQRAVHQREKELLQRKEDAVFKAAWSPFYAGVADDYEVLAMRAADASADGRSRDRGAVRAPRRSATAAAAAAAAARGSPSPAGLSAGLVARLHDGSPWAAETERKLISFASVVSGYPPAEWVARFAAYARDGLAMQGASAETQELAAVWATAEQLLTALASAGSATNTLSYAAESRSLLEGKSLGGLLTTAMKVDPSRVEEASQMPADRVLDLIRRVCGEQRPWLYVFEAMRCGRYDVAALAARQIGSTVLEDTLKKYAEAGSAAARAAMPPALELRDLYASTRHDSRGPSSGERGGTGSSSSAADVHRHAVLFLLLAGSTGESAEVAKRILFDLCSQVGRTIEDVLWMRLCCVRTIEETARGGAVQSLRYLQTMVLDDLADLAVMAQGNTRRIAAFLVHALLPSSGLRLLLEEETTYVDGLHLTLCFSVAGILDGSALEAPLDVARHLARYSALVLLDGSTRCSLDRLLAGASTFDYFHKTGFDAAFSELCLKDSVAAKLFGEQSEQPPAPSTLNSAQSSTLHTSVSARAHQQQQQQQFDGLLFANRSRATSLPPELVLAMNNTAALAATRKNTPLALRLLLVLARRSAGGSRTLANGLAEGTDGRSSRAPAAGFGSADSVVALQRAVRIACPALAEAFYQPPHTSHTTTLMAACAQLRQQVHAAIESSPAGLRTDTDGPSADADFNSGDINALDTLCTMADFFLSAHSGNLAYALSCFFALPFIPTDGSPSELERCVTVLLRGGAPAAAPSSPPAVAAVCTAAMAIVPLAFRVASAVLQQQQQQQPQHDGGGGGSALQQLCQAMQRVCEWLRCCRAQSQSSASTTVAVYEACAGAIASFEETYAR